MAMFHPFQHGRQLPRHAPMQAEAEHVGQLVGSEAEQSQVAGTLEEVMNGEIASEHVVATVFDLLQGVVTIQVDGGSVFLRKLRAHDPSPVVQLFANNRRAQTVGGRW